MSLIEPIMGMLSEGNLNKVSKHAGLPEDKAKQVLPDVLAIITSALASNTSDKKGAQLLLNALAKDHDGSILDNLTGYIGKYQSGEGNAILRHVLGNGRTSIEIAKPKNRPGCKFYCKSAYFGCTAYNGYYWQGTKTAKS